MPGPRASSAPRPFPAPFDPASLSPQRLGVGWGPLRYSLPDPCQALPPASSTSRSTCARPWMANARRSPRYRLAPPPAFPPLTLSLPPCLVPAPCTPPPFILLLASLLWTESGGQASQSFCTKHTVLGSHRPSKSTLQDILSQSNNSEMRISVLSARHTSVTELSLLLNERIWSPLFTLLSLQRSRVHCWCLTR